MKVAVVHNAIAPGEKDQATLDVVEQAEHVAASLRAAGHSGRLFPLDRDAAKTLRKLKLYRPECIFNLVESVIARNGALLVNAAILILAATVFYRRGIVVTEIQQAYQLLTPILGTTAASILFAIALLCSGQASTLTGTMAGQIVMEGFLQFRMRPWLRRIITRRRPSYRRRSPFTCGVNTGRFN